MDWDVLPLGEDYESWSDLMKEFFLMAIIDGIKEDYETLICMLWLIHKILTCEMVCRDLKLKFQEADLLLGNNSSQGFPLHEEDPPLPECLTSNRDQQTRCSSLPTTTHDNALKGDP